MKIIYSPGAKADLEEFSKRARNAIRTKIEELKENPTSHKDSKLIKIKGKEIYRLEIKEEREGEIDHRAIYDIKNSKIRIYSIIYREEGYQNGEISERF